MIQNRENGKNNNNKNKKLENIDIKMEKRTNDFEIALAEQSKSELLLNSFFEGFVGVKVNLPSPWAKAKRSRGCFYKSTPCSFFCHSSSSGKNWCFSLICAAIIISLTFISLVMLPRSFSSSLDLICRMATR